MIEEPTRGLLDTSTLLNLAALKAMDLPEQLEICTITLAELSVGPLVAATDQDRVARQLHLQPAEADFDPVPFDAAAARAFGLVAASLRQAGRKPAARAYDALIAATAIANDLPLYTSNPSDFEGIMGLDVRAVTPQI